MNQATIVKPQSEIPPKINRRDIKDVDIIHKYFFLFLHNWYYFLIALAFTCSAAYLYNRFILPSYKVTATLLIDESQQNSYLSTENFMEGFGLRPGHQNLDNQIQILSSWSIVSSSLRKLPFELDYITKGRINSVSMYPYSPFKVVYDSSGFIHYGIEFSVLFLDGDYVHIAAEENDFFSFNKRAKFGEMMEAGGFNFRIEKDPDYWHVNNINKTKYFVFHRIENLVGYYRSRLEVLPVSRESSMVELSLEGPDWRKDEDFLFKLIEVFQLDNLSKKNHEADRTIKFIDNQLKDISDSLIIAEDRLQEFRSVNRVMDISAQGSQVLEQAVSLEDERARLMIQKDYYSYLNDYLSNNQVSDQVIAPSTMGISDPTIVNLVGQLAELQAEYFSFGAGGKNPMQVNLSVRIQNVKKTILETLKGVMRSNDYAINENQIRQSNLNRKAESLPVTERKLLGIEREFQLNDALYTFLLQKQAEAQIQKASNKTDTEIIDPPRVLQGTTWPNTRMIYLVGIVIGIGIPLLLVLFFDAIKFTIVSEDDIKSITNLPITGHILQSKNSYQTELLNDSKSIVSESFRSLRARMRFFTKDIKTPVILVTSSMPGEGKTYIAINLASAYSLEKKKTILVGFDLRRPKLYDDFSLSKEKGASTFLIGKEDLSDLIQKTEYPFLDVLPAGPIPPNPAELTISSRTNLLIQQLKEKYDCIVIDSAPLGAVSDSLQLAHLADATLLIVRHKKSLKRQLELSLSEVDAVGIKELAIVINGLVPKKGYYGYKYGYQ